MTSCRVATRSARWRAASRASGSSGATSRRNVAGEAELELARDGASFTGRWRPDGAETWRPWTGRRVAVDTSTTWLVVLEAPWQGGLTEPEYSFGGMLRAIFGHVSGVSVRQRFFASPEGFEHACAEAARLSGPVVLVVAAHGGPEGVHCAGGTVEVERLAAALGAIPRLRAVHFSSCSVMSGAAPERIVAACAGSAVFEGVSGYTRPVDWMGSALCEFTWLELVLARGRTAAQAAAELPRLLAFAGARAPEGSAIPASHFRFVGPERAASSE